jgi:hypothetical protein
MWWMASALASTIEIAVPDPMVTSLILECATGTYKADVRGGMVTFDHLPQNCRVFFIRKSGVVDDTGKWTCGLDQCSQEDILHREVVAAPNRVNVIITTELPKGAAMELTCPGGFRLRTEVLSNVAVFDGVPTAGECTLFFKGGVPARYQPMGPGNWSCGIHGSAAVCKQD